MKTILRILVILMVGTIVSGALYLTFENTSLLLSDSGGFPERTTELGEGSEMPASDTGELPTRPEGGDDHNAASLSRGLSEVGIALAKLTGITLLVLLIQKVFEGVKKWRAIKPALG